MHGLKYILRFTNADGVAWLHLQPAASLLKSPRWLQVLTGATLAIWHLINDDFDKHTWPASLPVCRLASSTTSKSNFPFVLQSLCARTHVCKVCLAFHKLANRLSRLTRSYKPLCMFLLFSSLLCHFILFFQLLFLARFSVAFSIAFAVIIVSPFACSHQPFFSCLAFFFLFPLRLRVCQI